MLCYTKTKVYKCSPEEANEARSMIMWWAMLCMECVWNVFVNEKIMQNVRHIHSEKSLARSMSFYSRNCWQLNLVQLVLFINSDWRPLVATVAYEPL